MFKRTHRHRIGSRTPAHVHSHRPPVHSYTRHPGARAISGSLIARLLVAWLTVGAACSEGPTTRGSPSSEAGDADGLMARAESANRKRRALSLNTDKPVIWCFVGSRDKSESLKVAIESGLITHVAIFAGNRVTSDTLSKPNTKEAIDIAKRAQANGIELILVRYLWQTQPSPHTELATLTDEDYYAAEIDTLRAEARTIGAKYIGLDTEAYGPTPITTHIRSKRFSRESYDEIKAAVNAAVEKVGKVDFVLPAGSARRNHPYLALANLGEKRIAEGTYYDNPDRINSIKYPYEIAGMYMNVKKENERHTHLKYFVPMDVFSEHKDIWQQKQGLMIWPREHRALEVAEKLLEFSKQ